MYTKQQQIRKAQKKHEHELKRKKERKIIATLSGSEYTERKETIANRVKKQQELAHEKSIEKKMLRMDSINRKGII